MIPQSLAEKSARAVYSTYAGTAIRVAAQFTAQILIVRALGPEQVGTFAWVLLLHTALALAIDQGYGWSLIHSQPLEQNEQAIAFTRVMAGSVLAAGSVVALALPLRALPEYSPVAQVLLYSAPAYLLVGPSIVAQAQMRAELRFGEIQRANTVAYLLAYPLVGVCLALSGAGLWSLMAAWYLEAAVRSAMLLRCAPHSLRLVNPFAPSISAGLGRKVASINIVNWAVENIASLVVAQLGVRALGLFNTASSLSRTPVTHLVQTLQTIIFSVASLKAEDPARCRQLCQVTLATVALVMMPAYAWLLMHADVVVQILLGAQWQPVAPVLTALAPAMVAMALAIPSAALLTALGGESLVLRSQLLCLLLAGLPLLAPGKLGLTGIAVAFSLACTVRLLLQLHAISRVLAIAFRDLASSFKGAILIGLVFALPLHYPGALPMSNVELLATEAALLALRLLLATGLLLLFPRFVLGAPLFEVLNTFPLGRRLCSLCPCL